ncbi:unnamed protein product [Didymodactylos carnosus]|uniref:Uncharacterized protein n=1 Tax=Didymodactylos carnosus TaxID=1234261 RepID=A0A8S2CYQ2_9BILA|nr:unnamed protein product [Didymodactylos carnosus]CAF3580125.1 unnamed protein product [Didymodactylos carnosus]
MPIATIKAAIEIGENSPFKATKINNAKIAIKNKVTPPAIRAAATGVKPLAVALRELSKMREEVNVGSKREVEEPKLIMSRTLKTAERDHSGLAIVKNGAAACCIIVSSTRDAPKK